MNTQQKLILEQALAREMKAYQEADRICSDNAEQFRYGYFLLQGLKREMEACE